MGKRGKLISGVVTASTALLLVYFLSESTQMPSPDSCQQTLAAAALAREGGDQNTLVDNALLQQPSCEEDAEASSLR